MNEGCPNTAAGATAMHTELREIRTALDQLLSREELLEQLHRRLAAYEQDERVRGVIEPLVRKVAPSMRRLDAQIALLQQHQSKHSRASAEWRIVAWFKSCLEAVRQDLANILDDLGVDVFVGTSDKFDRSSQEIVQRISTWEPSRVGQIARRLAPGFRYGERILIPERVAAYVAAPRSSSELHLQSKEQHA